MDDPGVVDENIDATESGACRFHKLGCHSPGHLSQVAGPPSGVLAQALRLLPNLVGLDIHHENLSALGVETLGAGQPQPLGCARDNGDAAFVL